MKLCPRCRGPIGDALSCAACGHTTAVSDGIELYAPDHARAGHGFDPQLYTELAALEDHNFWFQARNRLIVRAVRAYFPTAQKFLEIGCGAGQVLRALGEAFPYAELHGSELFVEGLAFARRRAPEAHLMQMDATCIPYLDEFDLIGAFDVVEHIENDTCVLKEMYQALKPGGGAILTVPQHPSLWSRQDELACHERRYRRHELESKLRACGFRILYTTSFVSILLPLMAISRWTMRRSANDTLHEMRIGGFANGVFSFALRAEYALLGTGVRLPVGGSRLVAAVKDF